MTQYPKTEELNDLSIDEFFAYFEVELLSLLELAREGNIEQFEESRLRLCEQVSSFLEDKPADDPLIEEMLSIYSGLSETDVEFEGRSFYDFMVDNIEYLTINQNEQ